MANTRFRLRPGVLLALGLAGLFGESSCGGGKQSLVVVALTASPADTTLKTVVIDVDSVSKTFMLTGGLGATPASFGVYVPSSVKGSVLVAATAKRGAAKDCMGYQGQTRVTISRGVEGGYDDRPRLR